MPAARATYTQPAKVGSLRLSGSDGSGYPVGRRSLIAFVADRPGHGLTTASVKPVRPPTGRAGRPANSALDSGRFAADFGYRAPPWRRSVAAVAAELAGQSDRASA